MAIIIYFFIFKLCDVCSQDKWSLNEFCGDSEEMTKVAPKEEEIEEFFAMAEKYEQKRFAEK